MVKRLSLNLLLIVCEILSLSAFTFLRNLKIPKVEHRSAVLTLFQCADLCSTLNICKAFTFDRKNKICHISNRVWTINEMQSKTDCVYAEKNDLPEVFTKNCTCAENDICILSNDVPTCIPFYQCINRRFAVNLDSTYCSDVAACGGCDENNIGEYIPVYNLWNQSNWEYTQGHCQRSCKLCNDRF